MLVQRAGGGAAQHFLGGGITVRSGGGGAAAVTFLLRDDFTSDDAAPLASPRTCEPGPGTFVVTDTGNLLSISGGKLIQGGRTATDDPRILSGAGFTRAAGLCFYAKYTLANASNRPRLGLFSSLGAHAVSMMVQGTARYNEAVVLNLTIPTTETEYFFIARSTGGFLVIGGALAWVDAANATTPLYPGKSVFTLWLGADSTDTMRATSLGAPWDTDDGIATQILAGARSPGDTWTHEADHLTFATITTLPSAGQIEFRFRIQDASNYWQITIESTGKMDLDEVVAGVATERGTATVVTAGERIGWTAAGTTISVYDSALRITYTSASNFQTETDGELETEGTGGSVTRIEVWPRTLSGTALSTLQAVIDA